MLASSVAGPGIGRGLVEGDVGAIDRFDRRITVGGPLLLLLLVTPMLWGLTRRLTVSAHDRARLLRSALDASDAERRRIARDLHDGVVQDLAGTAFSVSALARESQPTHRPRSRLTGVAASLRATLTSLRSLQAEIHPPDLHVSGLRAALEDLIAPAESAGVQASVSVVGVDEVSDERVALVWRVAQEAVRNALRHAEASTIAVTVRGDAHRLLLEVVDDGVGFDPEVPRDTESFGLRGLESLVQDAYAGASRRSTVAGRSHPPRGRPRAGHQRAHREGLPDLRLRQDRCRRRRGSRGVVAPAAVVSRALG